MRGGDGDDDATDTMSEASPDLVAKDFQFPPATLDATSGEELSFVFGNEDDTEHNFTVEELGVDEDVESSGSTTVRFTPDQPGEFGFFCEYHPNMTGTFTVK
jgi:plastocyanin